MAEARYNRLDNQSPTQTQLENTDLNVGRSAFDFSKVTTGNALIGALIPVDCFDVVPNEDISISLNAYLEFRNPTTRQLLNGFRVYFHGYFNDLSDLWEGADNWLDTGLRSDVTLSRPSLIYSATVGSISPTAATIYAHVNACTPLSLLNYLGLPAEYLPRSYADFVSAGSYSYIVSSKNSFSPARYGTYAGPGGSEFTVGTATVLNASNGYFPADCAFAYQRNWRDYYANRNLLMKNKFWFPNNEKHFILSYECTEAVQIDYGNEKPSSFDTFFNLAGVAREPNILAVDSWFSSNHFYRTGESSNPNSVEVNDLYQAPNLSGLKFRQFRGDRFTTALPFKDLIRGDVPLLKLTGNNLSDFKSIQVADLDGNVQDKSITNTVSGAPASSASYLYTEPYTTTPNTIQIGFKVSDFPLSQVTMNAIRELETMTVFKERQARISNRDSYYNGFIESQFGVSAKQHDMRGIYLGGFYQDVVVSPVTQTSESANTPLGTKAGIGVSNGSGTITNNFHTNNYGWIQIYMSIVPDVFYTQGKPRMFDKKNQLDMYFPIFNNLEPQAIKNKELYLTGNASIDDDVYAYEDRYAEYKSRPNTVTGFMALSHSVAEYDASRIMARRFSTTPELNNAFVMMIPENIDMSVFSVADEPPFDYQIGIQCRRVFPGPYTAVPGSMSSNLHA